VSKKLLNTDSIARLVVELIYQYPGPYSAEEFTGVEPQKSLYKNF